MAEDVTQTQQETGETPGQNIAAPAEANTPPEGVKAGDKSAQTLTLTQDALDRIIDERLVRQRAQLQKTRDVDAAKAEALRLAEAGEFKTLADQRQLRIAELERDLVSRDTDVLRGRIAAAKRLDPDLLPFVTASTEDDITAQVETLVKKMAPPRAPATESGPARPVTDAQTRQQAVDEYRRRYGQIL